MESDVDDESQVDEDEVLFTKDDDEDAADVFTDEDDSDEHDDVGSTSFPCALILLFLVEPNAEVSFPFPFLFMYCIFFEVV